MPALNNALPEACRVASQQTYVNPFDDYCFAYPSRFELEMSPTGQPELYGPALEQSRDSLRARLALEVEVADSADDHQAKVVQVSPAGRR